MTSGRVRTRLSLQPSSDFTAEIFGGEVEALDARPHGAVVDEDAVFERFEVGRVDWLTGHAWYLIRKKPARGRWAGAL